jgi:hypothetical protein
MVALGLSRKEANNILKGKIVYNMGWKPHIFCLLQGTRF